MILTPNERSFYLAPDDISFFNIITVLFDTEPPPTDGLLDAVSEEVSSLVSAPRKNSILHIFVCLVTVALEVILEFWKKEEIARSKIWALRRVPLEKLKARLRRVRSERVSIIHHDNARPHTSLETRTALDRLGLRTLPHPP